jgi:uncharacterized protein involved in oxidation of intracellular sulfur
MKLGLIIQSDDPETVWNALRFANTSLKAHHDVQMFLLGKGVELERIHDSSFDVQQVLQQFLKLSGRMYACGTCLESRELESKVCPVSNMAELLRIVAESDKVLVF